MLASTFFDPVLGLDTHIVLVPSPAGPVPTPIPFPFIGMVFDPVGVAIGVGLGMALGGGPGLVLVNGLPATNCGTGVTNKLTMPHIPAPGPFAKPPGNDAELLFGALDVSWAGSLAVRLGDVALSCSDPIRLPTSLVLAIPKGPLVLVMRPMVPDVALIASMAAMKGALKVLGKAMKLGAKLFKKLRLAQLGSERWAQIAERLKFGGEHQGRLRSLWDDAVCFLTGHPVDVATGRVITRHLEVELPGPLPLRFERRYDSSLSWRDGALGPGWAHSYQQAAWQERGAVVYRAADGREIEFPTFDLPDQVLGEGQSIYNPFERLTARGRGGLRFEIETEDGLLHELGPVPGGDDRVARILRTRHRHGDELSFSYDAAGRLAEARHSRGRRLTFAHDEAGRLLRVEAIGAPEETVALVAAYEYDEAGDLVAARDAAGHSFRFLYVNHLLVKETDRNGLSFYFQYDGLGWSARCVRTWGDGGLYDHVLTYDLPNRRTIVEDSLGHPTCYEMNEINQVVAVTDPLGGVTRYTYDPRHGLLASETGPLGATVTFAYDERGNCTRQVGPDGASQVVEYDHRSRPVRATDRLGGEWGFRYDERGRLVGRSNPLGERMQIRWEEGDPVELTDAMGQSTGLTYDSAGNLVAIRTVDGAVTRYAYDGLGRCRAITDARGNTRLREHDSLGRVVLARDPDGNTHELAYDAEGALVLARDANHEVRLTYRGLGRLDSRTEGGVTVGFAYDSEDRLVAVTNEAGAIFRFELGPTGQVDAEERFDGVRRTFRRDRAGRVVRVLRGGGATTDVTYDPAGRVAAVKPSDGSGVEYAYRADGALVRVATREATVMFERDALGRVVKETVGEDWVSVRYDALGRRVSVQSSRGLAQRIRRNAAGDVVAVSARQARDVDAAVLCLEGEGDESVWRATFARDVLGLELERALPGGVRARWQRDGVGRPTVQEVWAGDDFRGARQYTWGPGDRLRTVVDALTGPTTYQHDELGRLVAAVHADGGIDLRLPDAVGNLFRSERRDDRTYGPGGRLLEARGPAGATRYEYDADGNLIGKLLPDGAAFAYEWDGMGRLVRVRRPDGASVEFGYDGLGRRLWKTFRGRRTCWLWDGNVPLHEWSEADARLRAAGAGMPDVAQADEIAIARREAALNERPAQGPPAAAHPMPDDELVTWLFEPDTFAPLGKLVGERRYGVVVDHLHTPVAMYDDRGAIAWSAQLDAYGELRRSEGDAAACPFRWPGQYEDPETGLYYNRYRYYDPEAGQYVSQDPLGLEGGLGPYAYSADPSTTFDVFGLKEKCERFVRYMSAEEASASRAAGGLVPDMNRVTGREGRKAKWISREGSAFERSGTSRRGVTRVVFEVEPGTARWLEEHGINFEDVAGEAAAPDRVLLKSNEPGSYGVGKDLLAQFNERVTKVIFK